MPDGYVPPEVAQAAAEYNNAKDKERENAKLEAPDYPTGEILAAKLNRNDQKGSSENSAFSKLKATQPAETNPQEAAQYPDQPTPPEVVPAATSETANMATASSIETTESSIEDTQQQNEADHANTHSKTAAEATANDESEISRVHPEHTQAPDNRQSNAQETQAPEQQAKTGEASPSPGQIAEQIMQIRAQERSRFDEPWAQMGQISSRSKRLIENLSTRRLPGELILSVDELDNDNSRVRNASNGVIEAWGKFKNLETTIANTPPDQYQSQEAAQKLAERQLELTASINRLNAALEKLSQAHQDIGASVRRYNRNDSEYGRDLARYIQRQINDIEDTKQSLSIISQSINQSLQQLKV